MIQNVIFDLGGVLIDWNPRYLYRKLLDSEERVEWFLSHVCTAEWNSRQDAGRPFAEAVSSLVKEYPQHQSLIRAFQDRWVETLGGAIEGSVRILSELKSREIPVYALSNWSAETFPKAKDRFHFLNSFDGLVISGEVGMTKPDPGIFQVLVNRFNLEPSRSLFIDDSLRNIETARQLGFNTHLFEQPEGLRALLLESGLLLPF